MVQPCRGTRLGGGASVSHAGRGEKREKVYQSLSRILISKDPATPPQVGAAPPRLAGIINFIYSHLFHKF